MMKVYEIVTTVEKTIVVKKKKKIKSWLIYDYVFIYSVHIFCLNFVERDIALIYLVGYKIDFACVYSIICENVSRFKYARSVLTVGLFSYR